MNILKLINMKIKPLGSNVIVELNKSPEKVGSVHLPPNVKIQSSQGTVIAVGTGRLINDGTRFPIEVKEGDKVIVNLYQSSDIKIDGHDYKLLSEDEIIAIVE